MEQRIRGYTLQEKIGEGGFGAVYRAYQPVIEREVAIKVVLPKYANQPDFIRSFETEAQMVAKLEHPYIVPLYDFWRDPDGAYLVMRWLPRNLRQAMTQQDAPFHEDTVLRILTTIATALHMAHRKGIVHRDLKPDNILLDEEENAYLTDFGIARPVGRAPSTDSVSGTLDYISPEQLQSQIPSPQMDIYSLGIMLYEMISGQHPFAKATPIEMMYHHISDPVPDISTLGFSANLDDVLQRATAKNTDERYSTTIELLDAFRAALGESHLGTYVHSVDLIDVVNPYKGLRAFDFADAEDFFGREALVDSLLQRLRADERFIAIVGPSGSGKSSVVKAGLVAAIRKGAITNTQRWFIAEFTPGSSPFRALAEALISVSPTTLPNIEEQFESSERGLVWVVNQILTEESTELLLIIDQFEELFTQVEEEERSRFLALLTTALKESKSNLRVILTLRADFYDRPLMYEGFGELVQDHTQVVLPLSAEELERAVTGPAQRVGVQVESELIAAIVSDVREEPGALPLLQYALTELFEHRSGNILTLAAYRETGGVLGVLAHRAGQIYETLSEEQQAIAKQVFLRMVTLGEGVEDTRRRVRRSELAQIISNHDVLSIILDRFGSARLLTFDVEGSTREPLVEVAHEALIREWGQLRIWLSESRDDLRLQRMLASAVAEWHEHNQDPSYLLRGARLAQFEGLARHSSVHIAPTEQAFLEASEELQDAEMTARAQASVERERLLTQLSQRQKTLYRVLIALAIGGVLAVGLSIFSFFQTQTAREEASANATAQSIAQEAQGTSESLADAAVVAQATSEQRVINANVQQLALRSQQAYQDDLYSRALSLAVEANRYPNPPPDAVLALSDASNYPVVSYLPGHEEQASALALSPDGTRLLSSACSARRGSRCSGAELYLWDLQSGEVIRRMEGHENTVTILDIAADGRMMLSGSSDGSVILWDLETGDMLRHYPGQRSKPIIEVGFAPDGRHFLTILITGELIIRETHTGIEKTLTIEATAPPEESLFQGNMVEAKTELQMSVRGAEFLPDSRTIALILCQNDNRDLNICDRAIIGLFDLDTGERLHESPESDRWIQSFIFNRDGSVIYSVARTKLMMWEWQTGEFRVLKTIPVDFVGSIRDLYLGISPDGQRITLAESSLEFEIVDVATGQTQRALNMPNTNTRILGIEISEDGSLLSVGQSDGQIMLIQFNRPDELYSWVLERREILPLTCDERKTYGLEPLCDEEGNIPPTPTVYPSATPFPTVTLPVWTPIPSPTAGE